MIDCAVACKLLEEGLTPGAHTPTRAALGFHLATCAACRAHRAALHTRLLADLLGQAPLPVATPTPAPLRAPSTRAPRRRRGALPALRPVLAQTLWYGGLATLAAFGVLVLAVVSSGARSVWHIHQNVQAMIVATDLPASPAPASPTPAPHATAALFVAVPPAPATPTAPPTPTAAPTVAPTATAPPAPASGGAVTVLLLGVDRRPGETAPPRTDSIIIARIEPQTKRIALLSLPRDLVVPIPGFGRARINGANILGERNHVRGGGAELSRQTVSELLNIPIDYYILIDFQGFISVIDTLGGVAVDVERELYDAQFPTMNYGYTVAHFLPGPQRLDGATALMFSRIRHSDSDFARIRRQQQVLLGIVGQLRTSGASDQLEQLDALTGVLRGYVKTNMPEERIIGLAWALRDLAPEQIERYAMRADQVTFGIGTDKWAELAKPGVVEHLAAQVMGQK